MRKGTSLVEYQKSLGIPLVRVPELLKVTPARVAFPDPEELTRHLARKRREILLRCPPSQQWEGFSDDPDDPPWPVEKVIAKRLQQVRRTGRRQLRGAEILSALADGGWKHTSEVAEAVGDAVPRRTGKSLYRLYQLGLVHRVTRREWASGMGWKKLVARPYYRINAAGRKWLAEQTEKADG